MTAVIGMGKIIPSGFVTADWNEMKCNTKNTLMKAGIDAIKIENLSDDLLENHLILKLKRYRYVIYCYATTKPGETTVYNPFYYQITEKMPILESEIPIWGMPNYPSSYQLNKVFLLRPLKNNNKLSFKTNIISVESYFKVKHNRRINSSHKN